MKILRPAHNIPAEKVKSWSQIKEVAQELRKFTNDPVGVEGYYQTAYAISHAQVSDEPLDFFCINEKHKDLIKLFGSWCIVNLEILETKEPCWWKEACLSFPFRKATNVDRFNQIKVKYRIPFLGFTRPVVRRFVGLPAFVAQHEEQHSRGKSIYKPD